MSEWDRTMQPRNYAASCPNCGGYTVVEPEAECSRCEMNLTPGCPNCRQPVDINSTMAAGLCFLCGQQFTSYVLVRPHTTTA